MTARAELRALTGVRGIAAWWVVLYHIRLSIAGLPPFWLALFAKGYLAVDFFFLLSGFVLWLSWNDRLRSGGIGAIPGFLWRRLARIWPLHLFMLACATALALALAAIGKGDAQAFPFAALPLHILLLQNWGFTDRLAWNDPSWSISTEWAAYILFPVLAIVLDWRRVPTAGIVAAIVALGVLLHAAMAGALTLGTDIWSLGLRRCLIEFVMGTATCALWSRYRTTPIGPAMVALFVFGGAVTACALGARETLVVPCGCAAGLLALALTSGLPGNPLAAPFFHRLGEISYATYLGHFLLFVVVKLVLVRDAHAVPPPVIALYLALVLASSVVLYARVEQPAQERMNRLAKTWRAGSRRHASAVSS
ncbi:acyltransferase [Sphingomonas sp. TREG-RG-20F-R18-01]|uniref:acyltransferase family protein n=1 Tax=Sphingomonas sp. TREG-RG-20F-R18-01 TaxID=2914982 RepID=UPI001F5AAF1A